MMKVRLWYPLLKREFCALCAHRTLLWGLLGALGTGVAVSLLAETADERLWVLYQLFYYVLPMFAMLGSIMLVRQDLGESPFLALLPGSSCARVVVKMMVSIVYVWILIALLLLPSAFGEDYAQFLLLGGGAGLVALVFVCLGIWRGFRSRTEVRAYLGGLVWWIVLLLGSGALGFCAHQWLRPEFTPAATLVILMSNPLESFRIFVFFGLSAVPMNPQTLNGVALWWMGHSMVWLALITLLFSFFLLLRAGWNLRLRAHSAES